MRHTTVAVAALSIVLQLWNVAQGVEVYSGGMTIPLMITQAPDSFGTFGGDYIVPDPGVVLLWRVPQAGGAPLTFADLQSLGSEFRPTDTIFLPDTGWGEQSGRMLMVAGNPNNLPPSLGLGPPGDIYTFGPDGAPQHLAKLDGVDLGAPFMISPRDTRFVPLGFGSGSKSGWLSVTDYQGGFLLLQPQVQLDNSLRFHSELLYDHNNPAVAGTALDVNPWGSAFAPAGFGNFGGRVLLADCFTGDIIAVDENGNAEAFTSVPLLDGQAGLRNLEFGPPDFLLDSLGIPGQQLFVSVAKSTVPYGDVLALDSNGQVVASLRVMHSLPAFNPRGLLFTADNQLLVCDLVDPVVLAQPDDFVRGRYANVPEPSVLAMLVGFVMVYAIRRKRLG
ncbi:MAG: hypothetical protein ACOY3P_22070 [Planctomycetota bacterium]